MLCKFEFKLSIYGLELRKNSTNLKFKTGLNVFLDIFKKLYNLIEKTNIKKEKMRVNLMFVFLITINKKFDKNEQKLE